MSRHFLPILGSCYTTSDELFEDAVVILECIWEEKLTLCMNTCYWICYIRI